jgi:EAL domain-containing protein (putative c-di-GMP-specific phosphodiesterase class I)
MLAQTLETPHQIGGLTSAQATRQARRLACTYGQGAFFCRPVSQEEFRLLLSRWHCPELDETD